MAGQGGLAARVFGFERRIGIASERYRVPRRAILAHLAEVYRRSGIRPAEALAIGIGDPAVAPAIITGCIGKVELMRCQNRLNPRSMVALTEDKGVFAGLCAGFAIPVPRTLAVVSRDGGFSGPGTPLAGREAWAGFFDASLPTEVVSKPAGGAYGRGVSAWTRTARGFVDHEGRTLTAAALFDALTSDAEDGRYVVQERVVNHATLARLSGTTRLQTIRVTTFVERSGDLRILHAFQRLIVGDNVVDNFEYGRTQNLAAIVDLDTGALGPGIVRVLDGVGIAVHVAHPSTGIAIEGLVLPDWEAVLALVERCARLFLPARTIGWDVALTPAGPLIIEGNRLWDPLDVMPDRAVSTARGVGWAMRSETARRQIEATALVRREASLSSAHPT